MAKGKNTSAQKLRKVNALSEITDDPDLKAIALANLGVGGTSGTLAQFAATTSAQLRGVISDETGTGVAVFATTPTLVTPVIGAATGTSLAVTGALTSSGTAGVGYATGAGGTVTQATDKTTTVVLNKVSGTITTVNTSMLTSTSTGFTVTNSTVAATDTISLNIKSGASANSYIAAVDAVAAGSFHVHLRNTSVGTLAEAVVLSFNVIKGVAA